jgi:hypothetical protein
MSAEDIVTRPRTPSVAELQAALQAAQRGDFATVRPAPAAVPRPTSRPSTPLPHARPLFGGRRGKRGASGPPAEPGEDLGVTLLGCHGGSGARCLSLVLPGVELADRAWSCTGEHPVVLVCRATHRGLTSAQDHAREHRDGDCGPSVPLLGAVVVADAPGRVPPPLLRLERLLAGAVPVLGQVPWMPAWRLGPPSSFTEQPAWLRELTTSIARARAGLPA